MVGEQRVENKSDYVNIESRTLLVIYNLKDSSQAKKIQNAFTDLKIHVGHSQTPINHNLLILTYS